MSLELAGFIVAVLSLCVSGYLAFIALKFTAKPRIRIDFKGEEGSHRVDFSINEQVTLEFNLQNIGYWYAKPAALDNIFYLNFDPAFDLIEETYGAVLEFQETKFWVGKGGYKFFRANKIDQFKKELNKVLATEFL